MQILFLIDCIIMC